MGADAVRQWSIINRSLILVRRITGALTDWTSRYPGDLLEGDTLAIFGEVVEIASRHPFMAHLTADLSRTERSLVNVHDVDMSWSSQAIEDAPTDLLISIKNPKIVTNGELLGANEVNLGRTEFNNNALVGKDDLPSVRKSTSSLNGSSIASMNPERKSSDGGLLPSDQLSQRRKQEKMGDASLHSGWTEAAAYILSHDPQTVAMNLVRTQWETFTAVRVS